MNARVPAANAALLLAGLLLAAPAASAQRTTADSLQLTLAGTLSRAAELSTPVLLSEDSAKVSGARVLTSYGLFLPAAAVGASAQIAEGTALLSSTALQASDARWRTASYQLSTALNIFNGFRDRAALRAATFLRDASGFSLAQARQRVSFDVLQAFYQVVLDRKLIGVAQANLALSQLRQTQLDNQVQVGTRSPSELMRQRAQTAADAATLIDAQARTQSDLIGLVRRLRLEPTRAWTIEDPQLDTTVVTGDSLSLDRLTAQALAARPDLQAAAARASAGDALVAQATGLYLPRVVLGADYVVAGRVYDRERQGTANLLTTEQRDLTSQLGRQGVGIVSLGISVPVFDRFSTQLEVEQARAAARQSRLAAEDVRLQVLGDVRQASDDYSSAVQKLRATSAGVASAVEAFDAVSARYDASLATFVDVQATQTALTDARARNEAAGINLVLRRAVLRYVTGLPVR